MQRLLGYLFFLAVGCAGIIALVDRALGGNTLNPLDEDGPDWLGVVLIATALVGGCALIIARRNGDKKDGAN